MRIPYLLLAVIFAASPVVAESGPALQPSLTGEPEIGADGAVTFRLKAPEASAIAVAGQSIPKTALTKDESGVWSATIPGIPAGVWEYSFIVDGVQVIDPGNPAIKPQRSPRTSILQIPSHAAWDFNPEIRHGTMHWHDYVSKPLNAQRRMHVYTPPGYEQSPQIRYPVLYLVHGFSDNDASWSVHGKANWILDNLIAAGKARPMIVVMPDGHPIAPEKSDRKEYGAANNTAFEQDLVGAILPLIESTYRTESGSASRALAGLSMGGGHTLYTGLKHLDQFAWLGCFSSGIMGKDKLTDLMPDSETANREIKLFWIACGKSDGLMPRNRELHDLLTSKAIKHAWIESEGGHEWPVWRNYLAEFAPLLFNGPAPDVPKK